MPHSIFVRNVTGHSANPTAMEAARRVLAHAIPSAAEAATIAGRIASSYPESGLDPRTSVFWFRDRKGIHEIWAAPER